jgi:hypothetical protein
MRSFQQRLATFTDNTADLVIQLWELNQLRERLRKAQQSARRLQAPNRRKRTRKLAHSTSLKADSRTHD